MDLACSDTPIDKCSMTGGGVRGEQPEADRQGQDDRGVRVRVEQKPAQSAAPILATPRAACLGYVERNRQQDGHCVPMLATGGAVKSAGALSIPLLKRLPKPEAGPADWHSRPCAPERAEAPEAKRHGLRVLPGERSKPGVRQRPARVVRPQRQGVLSSRDVREPVARGERVVAEQARHSQGDAGAICGVLEALAPAVLPRREDPRVGEPAAAKGACSITLLSP